MECKKCKADIPKDSKKCPYCGREIVPEVQEASPEEVQKAFKEVKKGINKFFEIFFIIPFVLFGSIMILSTVTNHMREASISKGYKKTEGVLINYAYFSNGKQGVYEYSVNGKNYHVTTEEMMEVNKFPKTKTVRYNPNSPADSLIYANCLPTTLIGLGIIALPFVLMLPGKLIELISRKGTKKKL